MNKIFLFLIPFSLALAGYGAFQAYDIQKKNGTASDDHFDFELEGQRAPQFELTTLDEKPLKLADFKGKMVLLNFWATWCAPCRAEIPDFIKVYNQYKDNDFIIIGIAIEDKEPALAFAKELQINYPLTYNAEAGFAVGKAYGNENGLLPYSVLISKNQNILKISPGILSEEQLKALIKQYKSS